MHHVAVADRARAAGIVAGHAAQRALRRGRDVDRIPEPMRTQLAIEVVEHDAGLDHAAPVLGIEFENAVQVFRTIDHQRMVDRLAALGGAATSREHGCSFLIGQTNRRLGLFYCARHNDAERHHLVVRSIGSVAAAVERIEQHVACDFPAKFPLQTRHHDVHRVRSRIVAWGMRLARCLTEMHG